MSGLILQETSGMWTFKLSCVHTVGLHILCVVVCVLMCVFKNNIRLTVVSIWARLLVYTSTSMFL